MVEESDEEVEEPQEEEEEEDEIVESDLEFEGETVDEPDNDPPQKVCLYFRHPFLQFIISVVL